MEHRKRASVSFFGLLDSTSIASHLAGKEASTALAPVCISNKKDGHCCFPWVKRQGLKGCARGMSSAHLTLESAMYPTAGMYLIRIIEWFSVLKNTCVLPQSSGCYSLCHRLCHHESSRRTHNVNDHQLFQAQQNNARRFYIQGAGAPTRYTSTRHDHSKN